MWNKDIFRQNKQRQSTAATHTKKVQEISSEWGKWYFIETYIYMKEGETVGMMVM